MVSNRRFIAVVIGGWIIAGAVRADMTPLSRPDAVSCQSMNVCGQTDLGQTNSSSPFACLSVTDLNYRPVEFLPEASADPGQMFETQHPQSLTNGPSSLSLCLSALMGLGLCSSAHSLKKVSFGFIPKWYCNSGPFQIGHCLAVSPDSVCPVSACYFVQPVWFAECLMPQFRLRTIVSLWRESQFTPELLASRGPPSHQ